MISRIFFSMAAKSSGVNGSLHGLRQHVGAVVTDQLERLWFVAGDQPEAGVLGDGIVEVGERAVERHRDRALGERGRDALGDLEAGDVRIELALGAVGEGEGNLGARGHGLQIAQAVLEAGFGLGLVGHCFSPEAHSCERAQVSGNERYIRRFGLCNPAKRGN